MSRSVYQVKTTFDDRFSGRVNWTSSHVRRGIMLQEAIPLPNAPMAAKDTLLAELLSLGRGLEFQRVNGERQLPQKSSRYSLPRRSEQIRKLVFGPQFNGQLLGIEIEYYPSEDDKTLAQRSPLLDVGHDGSLGDRGREARRITWRNRWGRLSGLLNLKLVGNVRRDCGLHVHVDMRHVSLELAVSTYEKLVKCYPFLKRLCPKSRWHNQYCQWKNNCDMSRERNFEGRYAAVNFLSYHEHKTFEFRCQGGTTNLIKIETWALICQHLVLMLSAGHPAPRSWKQFCALFPEPFQTWITLRREKLHGRPPCINERSLSALSA